MKKILCFILTLALVIGSVSVAYAKVDTHQTKKTTTNSKHYGKINAKKQSFKIDGAPVIKYNKYKLPIKAITQGMRATVKYTKPVLTVTKGTVTIVINFEAKTVTVNGLADTKSGIFNATNSKKSVVLVKYIANKLGVRTTMDGKKIITVTPGLDLPKNITITTTGTNQVANTVNATTDSMIITANITPGQATGGKAWLYIGSTHISTDGRITATDSKVTFKFDADDLKDLIKTGGVVSVRLYNANREYVDSKDANPTLVVDYATATPTVEPTATPTVAPTEAPVPTVVAAN